jgi:hypothetical protein
MCTGIVLYTKLAQACESVDLADSTGAVCGRCVRVQLLSVTDRREARKRSHKQKVRVRAYNV